MNNKKSQQTNKENKTKKVEREYITAISIEAGIIMLIEPEGSIGFYRQRGIGSLSAPVRAVLIRNGLLDSKWNTVKELPKNWTIEFEDEEIMGKARATFPVPKSLRS